jgi:glycosyltransferase involved in cell wall biosynthesis
MSAAPPDPQQPLVSVILTTRDRPRLLPLALEYYRHQTYPRKELIVVDDGESFPADAGPVEAIGGRLIRVPTGTPTGSKLNIGIEQARGVMCQKMDDDDWYAPMFLDRMVGAVRDGQTEVCRPTLSFVLPFLFFELASWQIRQSHRSSAPGATMLFSRDAWENRPFRPLTIDEDTWFMLDLQRWGAEVVPVRAWDCYLALRHRGSARERGHVWTHEHTGRELEDYLQGRPLHNRKPEEILPEFALKMYRELRQEILSGAK